MGTIINSVSYLNMPPRKDFLEILSLAGKKCLDDARLSMEEVNVLISAVVYNGNYLSEPALSSMIISSLCRDHPSANQLPGGSEPATFSFDLHNGGGGVLNAIQVIDGFIQSGEIKHGLIIAGDTPPRTGHPTNFNFSTTAGALLLSENPHSKGFVSFHTRTFPRFHDRMTSILTWKNSPLTLEISEKEDFLNDCAECATEAIEDFLARENLKPQDISLVLTSTHPHHFSYELGKRFPFNKKAVLSCLKDEAYSAGVMLSVQKAFTSGKFRSSSPVLLVTAGAGITICLALYMH